MLKLCDHTSVGILVKRDNDILLIQRARIPFGYALPAGHVDGDANFEIAAARELKEETGLIAGSLRLVVEGRRENLCRREGGNWHEWKIYECEAEGELRPNPDEVKRIGYYSVHDLRLLARRSEKYLAGEMTEEEWQILPGLEPVMLEWFKQIKLL